ncbi:chondroitin lyase [Izhakiella australiensis]|uniref:Chondroitin lyase n=1 Tax=Izhakiella australiensis TaxID=1926881 RepID=A0A1S8YLJ1_9GAMM|nr:heparinase II/III family protein [Izhakiella australiensis]OON39894.1 chondroitin lyase [Izhakiella australiensis]
MAWQTLILSKDTAAGLRQRLTADTLLGATLRGQQRSLDAALAQGINVPGQGEAGGPEHTQHKLNYQTINQAGRFWLITGERRYRDHALALLEAYAALYPRLGAALSKDTNPPGRLFHQTLNEHMFLLYAAEGYHCIMESLTEHQRQNIERHLLRLMAEEAMTLHAATFDIIHNHGIWSVAAVAICGYILDDRAMVDKSLYGLAGDGKSGGFFAQLDALFSPDGWYIEGPYYHRFALRPMLLLAQAIEARQPALRIWQYRQQHLRQCCYALLMLAFPDDTLPALNDGSKTMNLSDEGALMAVSFCWQHYGSDARLAALAQRQHALWPGAGALLLDDALPVTDDRRFTHSVLLRDGEQGDRGGMGILRQQSADGDRQMALMWFGQHGSIPQLHSALNHGHFDGLHLSWFCRGREVLRDYGFGRWVNIEPKFGGRYIAENNSYCKQSVAHNTVVVDEQTQNAASSLEAEKRWGECRWFVTDRADGQGMSAVLREYYPGVAMQRTVLMLPLAELEAPLLLDLFALHSEALHQYDYCLHGRGQLICTNKALASEPERVALGESGGYQHLWRCAATEIAAGDCSQLTWLDGDSFYSVSCAQPEGGELLVAMSGAGDPQFNLRQEPVWIWRTRGASTLFASAIEAHGYFDEATETSLNARSAIDEVKVLAHSSLQSRVMIRFKQGKVLEVRVNYSQSQDDNACFTLSWRE